MDAIELIKKIIFYIDPEHSVEKTEFYGQAIYEIQSAEAKKIIGKDGANLREIEKLIKALAEKLGIEEKFSIDVGDYKRKKMQELVDKARLLANRARSLQIDVEMPNLSSYERFIIHAALADEKDIKTESYGVGRDRRLVIKYSVE